MFDALKPLLDSGIINEDTRTAINEAWETKLNEAREQIRAELREEMAQRYEHDKTVMVEALDKMVTENLSTEIEEFMVEKQALVEDRVRVKNHMMESASRFNDFMVKKLAEEVKELHHDRKVQNENYARLEKFIVRALAEEIKEFSQDKKAVVETKVRLVAEAKSKLEAIQKRFIEQSARIVKESVTQKLGAELTQLKEDIQSARENMFGRRIFEAFASEFSLTHLNENNEIIKLRNLVQQRDQQIAEAVAYKQQAQQLVESKEREIRVIKESQDRRAVMDELLGTLVKEKQAVMRELLESVQTPKLKSAFEKYTVKAMTTSSYVTTFRVPKMSEFLNRNIEQFRALIAQEVAAKENQQDDDEEEDQEDDKPKEVKKEDPKKKTTVSNVHKTEAEKKREERKIQREMRKKKIEKLLKKEHMINSHEDVDKNAAIIEARATYGMYSLKMAADYEVPENMQINFSKKRQQMVLLEGSIHKLKVDFNNKILDLKHKKIEIIETVKTMNNRIEQINKVLEVEEK